MTRLAPRALQRLPARLDASGIARDDGLIGSIEIGGDRDAVAVEASSQAASTSLGGEAEHGGHGAGTRRAGLQHQLTPAAHQPGRIHGARVPAAT